MFKILLHYRLHKAVRIEVDDNVSDNSLASVSLRLTLLSILDFQ